MKRRVSLAAAAAALAIGMTMNHAAAQHEGSPGSPGSPVATHGRLRVEGARILDQHGHPAVLRGMSLFWSQWMPQFYNADCVRWLREDWGCTMVRAAMAVCHGGYLEHPEREKAKVRAVIDAAIQEGLYVLVDWHAHEPEPDAAIAFFSEIARAYGEHPNIIYEPWNEPLNTHDWATVIKPYHEKVIAAIRAHDPDNLIILGTQTWSQDVHKAAADPVEGQNLAYTVHFYAATHKQWLRERVEQALEDGIAIMVTEWGTSEATGNGELNREETRAWLDFMDEHGLSWCNWSVADKRETSAALAPGAPGRGGWSETMISPSGMLVRGELRAKAR